MKKILSALSAVIILGSTHTVIACGFAKSTDDPQFCHSFAQVARCTCEEKMPDFMCKSVDQVYDIMILRYQSQENACHHQTRTSFQTCMDDWNCYRLGGKDSNGNLCSSTGKACM